LNDPAGAGKSLSHSSQQTCHLVSINHFRLLYLHGETAFRISSENSVSILRLISDAFGISPTWGSDLLSSRGSFTDRTRFHVAMRLKARVRLRSVKRKEVAE